MDLSSKMSQQQPSTVSTSFANVSSASLAGSSPIRYGGNPSTFPAAFAMMDYSHPMSAIGAANPYRPQTQMQSQPLTAQQQQYLAAHQLQAAQEAMRYRAAAFFPPSSQVSPNMGPLPLPSFAYPALAGYPHHFAPGYPRNFFGRFVQREAELPKPQHSYIGLIAMAILSSPEKKMILNDIYQWIQDHYPYFKSRPPGWKNSIRHNLSLNACFVKDGRSATGKGHFWSIHRANVKDFMAGDFRRRKAQQKVHRSEGKMVGDDEEDVETSPSPSLSDEKNQAAIYDDMESPMASASPKSVSSVVVTGAADAPSKTVVAAVSLPMTKRKRGGFDMDSLLAPDTKEKSPVRSSPSHHSQPLLETKEEAVVNPLEQFGPRAFGMQNGFGVDFTKEQWDHSLSRILAHSYTAKFSSSS